MGRKLFTAAVAFLAAMGLSGCNVGNAPAAMDANEARAALDKMSPQDQIKYVATSPMPADKKKERYAEIEAKTGVKASDVLGGASGPGPGGGPPGG